MCSFITPLRLGSLTMSSMFENLEQSLHWDEIIPIQSCKGPKTKSGIYNAAFDELICLTLGLPKAGVVVSTPPYVFMHNKFVAYGI